MNKEFTYSAFISYSHKDQKYAQKLQKKLESYRLPSTLQHQVVSKSKHPVAPVFRDATDLVAGKLKENLHQELENSKFLIVICSPNSAQKNAQGKNYVNSEVDYFVSLGRADYIIPVIIDGIPGDPEKECFCSAVKSLELVGIDAVKFPEARVINDIAAKILGLRPDELWQREKRRILRNKILCFIGVLWGILLGIAGGICYWDHNREYIEYYADYIKKWNIPCGITPLSNDELKFRYLHWKFLYRGRTGVFGKRILREVTLRNSSGEITEDKTYDVYQDFLNVHIPQTVLIYNENGVLSHSEYYNKEGKKTHIESYSGPDLRFCDLKAVKNEEYREIPIKNQKAEKTFICRFDVVRDSCGRIKKCIYRSVENMESIKGPDGSYGVMVEYDKNSRIVTRKSLDFNGAPMFTERGYVCYYEYNKLGQLQRIRYADVNGNLINPPVGYASAVLEYDLYGNCTSICYFDADGNKTSYKDRFAKVVFSYKNGNLNEIRHWNKNNVPCTVQQNKVPACIKLQHDERGNLTEVAYFDTNNKPVYYESCAKKTMKYVHKAGRSFVASEEKKGINGELVHLQEEPSKYEYEYDANGNKIVERRYGRDNKLYRKKGTYAVLQKKFDDKKRCIYEAYYDADLRRMADKNGLAFCRIIYEANKITLLNYGPDEQLVNPANEGCAKYVKYYDEFKRFIRGECYDQNGSKMDHLSEKWHAVAIEYAPNNQISRMSFYDKDNKRCLARLREDGEDRLFSELRLKYDNNNIVEEAYYGVEGELIAQKDGYAVIQRRFNNDQLVEITFLDRNRALCTPVNERSAKTTYEYHANGKFKSFTFYSNDGRYECQLYDSSGYLIRRSFHAPNGELLLGYDGVAMTEYKNNGQGKEVERAFYDSQGKRVPDSSKVAGVRSSYDLKGNKTSESYFDLQGKICRSATKQIAKIRYQYNSAGQVIAEHYYDEQDRRMEDFEQIAGARYTYNKNGKILSIKFFGADEKIKNNIDGIHEIAFRYNARNCKIEELYRNAAGKLVLGPLKIAGSRFEYDEKDRLIKKAYIGLNGKITKGPEGYAVEVTAYDSMNNKTQVTSYDENLKKCNNKAGFSIGKIKYDNVGRIIELRFLDKDGQPANFMHDGLHTEAIFISYDRFANKKYLGKLSREGINNKKVKYHYSHQTDNGLVLESGWLDKNKKAADNQWGFAVKKYRYDLSGNLLEERTYDAAGNPCVDKRTGVSTTKFDYRYQKDGSRTIEVNYLGATGFHVERNGAAWGQFKYDKDRNLIYVEVRDKHGEFPLANMVKCHLGYDFQRRFIRLQQYGCIMQNGKKVLQKNNDLFFTINDEKGVVTCWRDGKIQSMVPIVQYNQFHQNAMRHWDSVKKIFSPIKKSELVF